MATESTLGWRNGEFLLGDISMRWPAMLNPMGRKGSMGYSVSACDMQEGEGETRSIRGGWKSV